MREPIVTVTAADCRWDYYRGLSAGGQHRNKTSSAVRCTHEPSGAVGQSEDTRSQAENKRLAFGRMARTHQFQRWIKLEAARRCESKRQWIALCSMSALRVRTLRGGGIPRRSS